MCQKPKLWFARRDLKARRTVAAARMRAHWSPPGRLSKPAGSKSLGGIFFSCSPGIVIKKNTAAPLFDIDRLGKLHQTLFRITWDFPARKPPDAVTRPF
jgi:hypothetical protein